jgi:hypothetical protein
MTKPETFVSRWSRLKRGGEHKTGHTASAGPADPLQASATGADETAAPPGAEVPAARTFDPASLPAIDSIAAGTDIRSFLHSEVPAELMRAALRRAWISDPAIRDFIGIAENQWDFTDPTAIPGFGPLRETDDMACLVAQALGTLDDVGKAGSATPDSRLIAVAERIEQPHTGLAAGPADMEALGPADDGDAATTGDRAAAGPGAGRQHRRGGGALPRWEP